MLKLRPWEFVTLKCLFFDEVVVSAVVILLVGNERT